MGCSQSTLVSEPVEVEASHLNTNPVLEDFPKSVDQTEDAAAHDSEPSHAEPDAPEAEVSAVAATESVTSAPVEAAQVKAFEILDEVVHIKGVVHYTVQAQDGTKVQKRYSEFKQLHDSLCTTPGCEGMPQAGVWTALQRTNQALVADRRAKFEALLNKWATEEGNKQVLATFLAPSA